jgi:hypothetical protein
LCLSHTTENGCHEEKPAQDCQFFWYFKKLDIAKGVSQMTEHLPSKHKVLSSNSNNKKEERKTEEERKKKEEMKGRKEGREGGKKRKRIYSAGCSTSCL